MNRYWRKIDAKRYKTGEFGPALYRFGVAYPGYVTASDRLLDLHIYR